MAETRYYAARHSRPDLQEVREIALHQEHRDFQEIVTAVTEYTELLQLLNFRQPMSGDEIRSLLGISKSTCQTSIKRLTKMGVVVKVSFEHNTLYLLNGDHSHLIQSLLH